MKSFHLYTMIGSVLLGVSLLAGCTNFEAPSFQMSSFGSGEPARQDGFGAIAFSTTTQRWHIRWNVSDQVKADALAIQYCGAEDCSVVLRYGPGQCGTFSLGDGGALGTGSGGSEKAATSTALAECTLSGQTCKVAPVRCNDQS